MREVTFSDFAKLANKRGLSLEYLTERFTDKIERPSEFFHRVFQGQYNHHQTMMARPGESDFRSGGAIRTID